MLFNKDSKCCPCILRYKINGKFGPIQIRTKESDFPVVANFGEKAFPVQTILNVIEHLGGK